MAEASLKYLMKAQGEINSRFILPPNYINPNAHIEITLRCFENFDPVVDQREELPLLPLGIPSVL